MKHDDPFDDLGTALAPGAAEPSDAEIVALRRAVARRFPARPWWRRPSATVLFAAAVAACGAIAFLAKPAREPAQVVATNDVVMDTKAVISAVRSAVAAKDAPSAKRLARELSDRIAALPLRDPDRRAIEAEVREVLAEVAAFEVRIEIEESRDGGRVKKIVIVDHDDPPLMSSSCDEDEHESVEAERVRAEESIERMSEQVERARERAEESAERAREKAEEARERAEEEADRAREKAEEKVEQERERLEEQADRAREQAEKAREQAERARERALREAEKAREKAQRDAGGARFLVPPIPPIPPLPPIPPVPSARVQTPAIPPIPTLPTHDDDDDDDDDDD